jgi:carbon monoxide dehydrogenase subunit G
MRFTNEIVIDRPPDEVFAYLADLENLPKWNYAIRETRKVSPGPVGIGTVYNQSRTLPQPMEEQLEITTYEPNRQLTVSGGFGLFHGASTYLVEPEGRGTRLGNEIVLESGGRLGPLTQLASRPIKHAVARNLADLKQILEQPAKLP